MQNWVASNFSSPRGVCSVGALRAVVLLAATGCFQPRTTRDDFGAGGQSTVVGDEPPDADAGGAESVPELPTDELLEPDDGGSMPSPPVDAASGATPTTRRDAGGAAPSAPADAAVAMEAGTAPPPATASLTKLSFSVQTASAGGRYAPRNVYAIWVIDAQGKFVKTLAKFARTRASHLTAWNASSQGNVVDAVTGATMSSHGVRSVTWDLTNTAGAVVADGDYQLVVELTDANGSGPNTRVSFSKTAKTAQLTPPNQSSFSNMKLVLE